MKSVLYLTYDGLTDPLGQSQILPYLIELSKANFEITIISFEKKAPFNKIKHLIEQKCKEASITWAPLIFHTKPPLLSKWYDRFALKRLAINLHKTSNFSMVHCRSYVASEVGLYFKKKLNVPFLFDMRGLWADEKVDCGQWDLKKWWYKKIFTHYKNLEKEYILNAAQIISLTFKGKDELFKLYGAALTKSNQTLEKKCTIIPTCADFNIFNYKNISVEDQISLRKKLNILPNQIVLSYSGSLGGWYMLNEMLLFFKAFKMKHPNAIFLFLTRDKKIIENAITQNLINQEDVVIHFSQKEELPLCLSLSKYSVFFISPYYSKLASSPTKHAELMGLGIPVFCNDIGDTGKLMNENNIGELVDISRGSNFEKNIENMNKKIFNKEEIAEVGKKYFDIKNGVKSYLSVYNKILNSIEKI